MGLGASNLSKSSLDVYQESITKIGQQLRANASNKSQQNVNINQTITVVNDVRDLCDSSLLAQNVCENMCIYEDRSPLYKCQFSTPNRRMETNNTNPGNCDIMFGTIDKALDYDGICEGTINMSEFEREDICYKRAQRLACPINPYQENTGQNGYPNNTCNNNCNQLTYIKVTNLGDGKKSYDIRDGSGPIYNKPSFGDWIELNGGNDYDCNMADVGGNGRLNGTDVETCKTNCAINYDCIISGESKVIGTIDCSGASGGLCLTNTANVSMSSDQLANSNIKSEMVANITNDFQSEVIKTISQANEGLNFSQFNTSDEMTTITQLIKNTITNSIKASAENENVQQSGLDQNITIINRGIIIGRSGGCPTTFTDCDDIDKYPTTEEKNNCLNLANQSGSPDYSECSNLEGNSKKNCQDNILNDYYSGDKSVEVCASGGGLGGCGCDITNSTVQDIQNKQEATAVIDSIFNSTVLNKLVSDYTLDVSQLNKGPTFNFIYILIALILSGAWVMGKVVGSSSRILAVLLSPAVLIAVGLVVMLIYYFASKDGETETPPASS